MNTSTTKNHATANVGKKEAGIIIDIVSKPYDIPPGFEFITANNRVKSINFEQLCASQPIKGHKNMTGLQTLKKVASKKLCPSNLMDSIASLSVQFVLDSKRIKTLEELETIYLTQGKTQRFLISLNRIFHPNDRRKFHQFHVILLGVANENKYQPKV